tara:strand:- start:19778 stop:21136 length:1359 start_codon:yes stop_codon:yes gene_type:complete
LEFSSIEFTHILDLPEPVTNGGVEFFEIGDSSYVYLFGGIDSTLKSSGIHRRCYKINVHTKSVSRIPDLPDTLGRIALSADRVGDKIYVVGGYHVFADGSEKTSSLVHEFDPVGDTFTSKKIVLPVPVDDHVQLVYKWNQPLPNNERELLYIIGGWSHNKNVPNVQIYDPKNNKWLVGTSLPDSRYLTFGAVGKIYDGNNIVFVGGASDGAGFPVQRYGRSGIIDKDDPTKITWSILSPGVSLKSYRSTNVAGLIVGGTDTSYNYNAKAYQGGKVLEPTRRVYYPSFDKWSRCEHPVQNSSWGHPCLPSNIGSRYGFNGLSMPMDIRDIAIKEPVHIRWGAWVRVFYVAGGILSGQEVSRKLLKVETGDYIGVEEFEDLNKIKVWPNPASNRIIVEHESVTPINLGVYNVSGKLLMKIMVEEELELDLSKFNSGIYLLRNADGSYSTKFIKQ